MSKDTIELNQNNISESAARLEAALTAASAEPRECMNALLLTEELFARMAAEPGMTVTADAQRRWGNVTLRLSCEGEPMNPVLESPFPEDDEQDDFRTMLLHANREKLGYSRKGRRNIVVITVHSAANRQIKFTLAAMLLGIVTGLICKVLLPDELLTALNTNVLVNIRTVFLNALKMMIAPLVFFSVTSSLAGMGDVSEIGRAGSRVLALYLITSLLACVVGTGLFCLFFGGEVPQIPLELNAARAVEATKVDLPSVLVGIVPSELVSPIQKMDVLQILFVSIFFGVVLDLLGDRTPMLRQFIDEANTFCTKAVSLIVRFLPLIAFVSMCSLVIRVGLNTLYTLGLVLLGHVLGVAAMLALYSIMLMMVGHISPLPFLHKGIRFMSIPFSLAGSNACIPFTLEFCTDKLGIPKKLAAFSIPIGSTVNMDGICFSIVFQGLMLAKMYGVDITPRLLLTTFLTALLLSVGAPGVAGTAFICLTTIVVSMGLPAEAATFVLGIDSLLSMLRISNNVIGDTAVACTVAAWEKQLDPAIYQKK